jgi:hypothetical protein
MRTEKEQSMIQFEIQNAAPGVVYWIEDPGHAWLRVPKWWVDFIEYKPTEFSYINDTSTVAYLEEDCDGPGFLEAVYGEDRDKWPKIESKYDGLYWNPPFNHFPGPHYPGPDA